MREMGSGMRWGEGIWEALDWAMCVLGRGEEGKKKNEEKKKHKPAVCCTFGRVESYAHYS